MNSVKHPGGYGSRRIRIFDALGFIQHDYAESDFAQNLDVQSQNFVGDNQDVIRERLVCLP